MINKETQKKIIHRNHSNLLGFLAGDKTRIKEILHPKNDAINLPYSLAFGQLSAGEESIPHKLENEEVYYFLEGNATIFIGENQLLVKKGDVVLVPVGASQYIINNSNSDLEFLCIVTPAWSAEKEVIL